MKSILKQRASKGLSLLAVSALFGAAQANAQTMEYFGDWVQNPGHVEYYVAGGTAGPLPPTITHTSISAAVAQAATDGYLGVVPVTINVASMTGSYNANSGETFPINLPAHGISIEAWDTSVNGLPRVNSFGAAPAELFRFDSIGNATLPPSVLQGLDIASFNSTPNAADIRIEITSTVNDGANVPVEIRDCEIRGTADIGVDIVGHDLASTQVVLERNLIRNQEFFGATGDTGVRVTGGDAPCSPLIRANEIREYRVNVDMVGGDLANQPRLHSNFIQLGGVNVNVDACAPWIFGNTIAFAVDRPGVGAPVGIDLNDIMIFTMSGNLFWNPEQTGFTTGDPVDVAGIAAGLPSPTTGYRFVWFNLSEDDEFAPASLSGNHTSGGLGGSGMQPGFVGGDAGNGLGVTDLHLTSTSDLFEQSWYYEFVNKPALWPRDNEIPGLGYSIFVRMDSAYDIDFQPRISGYQPEVGADEILADLGVDAPTRVATLAYGTGSASGTDADMLGNLSPSALNEWHTDIAFQGNVPPSVGQEDQVTLLIGVGFTDTVSSLVAPSGLTQNRSLYQHVTGEDPQFAGMLNRCSLGLDMGSGIIILPTVPVDAAGQITFNLNMGAATAGLVEGELYLQALVFNPAGTVMQASNRLPIDLNL